MSRISNYNQLFPALAVLLLFTVNVQSSETILFTGEVPTAGHFKVPIPTESLTDADWEKGEITFYITADNQKPHWTIFGMKDVMYLTDGVNKSPMTLPTEGHMGAIEPGHPLKLTFRLPPLAKENGITFENTRGIYGFSTSPPGQYTLEVWKGIRPVLKCYVDQANRCFIVDASAIGEEAERFHYTAPDGKTYSTPLPLWRGRIKPGQEPFEIRVALDLRNGERAEGTVTVTPRPQPLQPPLKAEDIRIGICYYSQDIDGHTNPAENFGDRQSQAKNVRDFIEQELGNLFILWSEEPEFIAAKFELLEEMAKRELAFMTIYHYDPPELLARYREIMQERFLENNIGEYASYLYQGAREAEACRVAINNTDLKTARDLFINRYIGPARSQHGNYKFFFSTSGSALAHYELAGGIDFMCSELYAIGAANVAYATAEMRGAARRWQPEYWGGWLAHEWQTTSVPYTVPQKYDMLKVGLHLQYLMGTSVIVLESGGDYTQAGKYTVTEKDSEWEGKPTGKNYNYFGHAAKEYRRTMKEFYDFVRSNPRPPGSPETNIALLLGNCDSWVGVYHDWFPAWAQHETAKSNPLWLYGDPERSWQAAMQVFFPILPDALKPHGNHWIGGSPYGQVDVVGIDEELWQGELSRYAFAAFAGWNSMVPELLPVLDDYVQNGGSLFLAVPHLSTRFDREYKDYLPADLIGGGDISALMDVRIEGRRPADSELKASDILLTAERLEKVSLADVQYGADVRVMIETADGRPVVLTQSRGKGCIYLLLTWEYPGNAGVAPLYQDMLRHLAGRVEQSVTISPLPDRERDTDAVAFAVYPGKVFFLNTDCVSVRSVRVNVDGKSEELTLQPTEMRIVER